MSEKKEGKNIFSGLANLPFIQKLKSVKHIGIIVAIIFLVLLLIIAFSGGITTSNGTVTTDNSTYSLQTSSQWIVETEEKLKSLISSIKNSGKVEVMLTLESGPEIVLASNVEQTTNTSTTADGKIETVTVTTTPILLDGDDGNSILVITEKLPVVKGIVVVSSGASNVAVKLNIIEAIQTLLSVEGSKIQVFVGN